MSIPKIVAVSANPGAPSRTRVLIQSILEAVGARIESEQHVIELSQIGQVLGQSHHRKELPPTGEAAIALVESADLLVVASPVYRASYTGLFKHLFDLVGQDALVGVPVILGATGGSDRHALVIEHQLRPLFSFFRAFPVPTGVYATEADFDGYRLVNENVLQRARSAAGEAVGLLPSAAATQERRLRAIA